MFVVIRQPQYSHRKQLIGVFDDKDLATLLVDTLHKARYAEDYVYHIYERSEDE